MRVPGHPDNRFMASPNCFPAGCPPSRSTADVGTLYNLKPQPPEQTDLDTPKSTKPEEKP